MDNSPTIHQQAGRIFGEQEEQAIITLAFDLPEFFSSIYPFLQIDHFKSVPAKFVFAIIKQLLDKHQTMPTRGIVKDWASRVLTVADEYEPILALIQRQSDPREVPAVKQIVIEFAKRRAYGLLYAKDVMDAVTAGDFSRVEEVIEGARKITDVSRAGTSFFDNIQDVFVDEVEEHCTSGFPSLDRLLNDGGPSRGDVFAWMAPTNVGKTYMLCNTGEANVRAGNNVIHISLEGDLKKTQYKYLGAFTNLPAISKALRDVHKDQMLEVIARCRAHYGAGLVLYKFPADEISVDTVHQVVDFQRRNKGFNPRVVIVDYLELMVSRKKAQNSDDYTRQKAIATELCGLADKENITVFTATQTNRAGVMEDSPPGGRPGRGDSGGGTRAIDLDRIAESFGKSMPLAYVVSINQSRGEYEAGYDKTRAANVAARARLFIAKNRNGPKGETVAIRMNYLTMKANEEEPLAARQGI
jgi:replicative DNA helicase